MKTIVTYAALAVLMVAVASIMIGEVSPLVAGVFGKVSAALTLAGN